MDHMECLDEMVGEIGWECNSNDDCKKNLVCETVPLMQGADNLGDLLEEVEALAHGTKKICILPAQVLSCRATGMPCGSSGQCCTDKCMLLADTVIPQCI